MKGLTELPGTPATLALSRHWPADCTPFGGTEAIVRTRWVCAYFEKLHQRWFRWGSRPVQLEKAKWEATAEPTGRSVGAWTRRNTQDAEYAPDDSTRLFVLHSNRAGHRADRQETLARLGGRRNQQRRSLRHRHANRAIRLRPGESSLHRTLHQQRVQLALSLAAVERDK